MEALVEDGGFVVVTTTKTVDEGSGIEKPGDVVVAGLVAGPGWVELQY